MTGVENGTYYSYWGTEINDPNTSLSEMTVGDLKKIVGGINDTIYTAQGDDIKQVSVQKSGDNGGTIGLIRRGDWNGTTYDETDPVPGTITVTSTGGTGGSGQANDVKIKFSNAENTDGFTVEAGSKVEATEFEDGKVSKLSINGENYAIGGGKTYTAGNGIAIDDENDNKISVRLKDGETNLTVDDTGLALNKDLAVDSVTAGETAINTNGLTVGGTTYVSAEGLNAGDKVIANVADGAIDSDAVNLGQLKDVAQKADDAVEVAGKHTIVSTEDNNLTVENIAGEGQAANYQVALKKDLAVDSVTAGETAINTNGLTVGGTTYVSKEGLNAGGKAITNVANGVIDSDAVNLGQLKDVEEKADDAVEVAGKHTIVSTEDNNLTVENIAEEGQAANYEVALNKDLAVDSVTAGGTTISSTGLTAGKVNVDATTNTVSGLSNTTWDPLNKNYKGSNLAATESQLEVVNTKVDAGWALYSDGNKIKDVKPGDNWISVDAGENVSISKNENGNGLTISADLKDLDVEDTNAVLYDDDDKTTVTLAGTNGTRITNVAKGDISEKSTDAVNGSQLYATNQKVDAGWTATDGNTNIAVNPKNNTLKFAGDKNINVTADKASSTINVELDPTLEVESVTASKDVVTIDGNKTYSLKDIGYNTQAIKYAKDHTAVDGLLSADRIENENGSFIVDNSGNVVVGKQVVVNSTSGTITGLTNKTVDYQGFATAGKAATEEQLQAAMQDIDKDSYKGWTVSTNGKVDNKVAVGSNKNVDFSNTDKNIVVGQEGTNLTFDLNDNITLGDESGTRIELNGSPQTDSMIAITNGDSHTVFNVAKDGTVLSDGDIIANAGTVDGNKYSLSEVGENAVRYNQDKTTVTLAGENGTTITNVADGIDENDAVNVGQLKDVATEAAKHTTVSGDDNLTVNKTENLDGSQNYQVTLNDDIALGEYFNNSNGVFISGSSGTISATKAITVGEDQGLVIDGQKKTIQGLSNTTWDAEKAIDDRAATEGQLKDVATEAAKHTTVSGDDNITVNKTENPDGSQNYQVTLDPVVTLDGNKADNNKVVLDGNNGTISATNTVKKGHGHGPGKTTTNEFTFDDEGATFTNTTEKGHHDPISSSTNINGGTITTDTVTGLSNTEWNGTTDDESRAATEGQLKDVSDTVNAGWIATDSKGNSININPEDNELKFVGDNNITVTANDRNDSINVELNPVVTLDGNKLDSDKVVLNGNDGTIYATNTNEVKHIITVDSTTNTFDFSDGGKFVTEEATTLVGATLSKTTHTAEFNEDGATFTKTETKGVILKDSSSTNIDGGTITTDKVQGLDNTTWNKDIAEEVAKNKKLQGIAATQGQLQTVDSKVNAGWIATDSNGSEVNVNPDNNKLNFAGDKNITVTATTDDTGNNAINVELNDDLNVVNVNASGDVTTPNVDGTKNYSLKEIGRNTQAIYGVEDGKGSYITTVTGLLAATTIQNTSGEFRVDKNGNVRAGDVVISGTGDIRGLANLTWDPDNIVPNRAATESQLQQVAKDVDAGWIATDSNGSEVNVTPDNNKLNFAGDKNITVTATTDEDKNNAINVKLNDNITLGNGESAITLNGSPEDEDAPALSVGDKFVVDQNGDLNAINNSGSAIMMNDDSVALNASGNGVAISDEGILLNANGSSVTVDRFNGTTFTNTNTGESTSISGATITAGEGENQIKINGAPKADDPALSVGTDKFVVDQNGSLSVSDKFNVDAETGNLNAINNSGSAIMMNDDSVALNASGNGMVVSDEGILLNTNGSAVTVDRFNGATFTNTNTGESTNINGGTITTNTVKGLANTTWNEELAEQVVNDEELQSTAATQGQLQQAVSEVATEAGKHTTVTAGDDNLIIDTSTNTNGGTNYEVSLGHNITLHNVVNTNEDKPKEAMLVFNTDLENEDGISGYIPDNYKDSEGDISTFVQEHGGFAIYYANPSDTTGDMTGTFGVTTDGVVHAKDVISYYSASSGSQSDVIRYSLNDVGDIVTQIAHSQFDVTGMDYTVISSFKSEEDKEDPFSTPEGTGERTIGLAVREDGAVVIGAVVDENGLQRDELGIRINDDTIVGGGKDTITGLDNIEWTPPTNSKARDVGDTRIASMAATVGQLDDLYGTVAAYDVDPDGIVDYNHITLAGTPYGLARDGGPTHTGGTSITNVAYASGKDGSEAVNVDYLNDAISDAAENGSISTSDQHLVANTETGSNGVYKPNDDGNVNLIVSDEKGNSSTITIGDVASKEDLDNLKDDVGDLDYSKVEGDTIIDGDSVTDAIGKLDNKIDNITGTATDADNNTVTGGKINSDGTISLTQKDKDSIKLEGQLTDSGVVQEGTSFDKETGTITITSQDKYSGETSSVKVEGIASTEVVGATNKEDLATAYKDADKDGNATTEYITDSESMVEADVALDHAIQDVAGTSYANDMVLSNRIDSVEKRLGNVEERIDKVGAMAAAIANLRTMGFDPEAPTEIAIGVGQYKSETGIAIGVFHYPNQDFMLSASLSSSGDELMGGIGATWKLGRKSAAERAKDEEARHLEQAEEMKKLAQQEKVKAQAQRHAKLLAERQQASQKNA